MQVVLRSYAVFFVKFTGGIRRGHGKNGENKNNKIKREGKGKKEKKGIFSHFIWQFRSFLPSL